MGDIGEPLETIELEPLEAPAEVPVPVPVGPSAPAEQPA